MKIYEIPQKLTVTWNSEVRAIIDTWKTYFISLEEMKEAVLIKGLEHAKNNNAQAWIVDSSSAVGVFSPEIQDFIGSDIFPAFVANGIKYFITINSEVSAMTRMNVKTYASKTGPLGLKLVELNSAADAIMWLKENS